MEKPQNLDVWDGIMDRLFNGQPTPKAKQEPKPKPDDCGHPESFYSWTGDGWTCKDCQTHIAYP